MQNSQDGTIIVPNEELQLIIKANNLPDDLGAKIQEHFSGPFSQLAEWQAKADSIVITSEDQVEEIALANDGRKTLVKIRTSIEKVRKELKDPYFRMGQTIDSVAKALTAKIEPIEADLKAKSDYAVNLAAERRNRLVAERKLALQEVGHEAEIPGLADLPEETFQMILGGAKEKVRLQREATEREAAEKAAAELAAKAEAERIANAEKVTNERRIEIIKIGASEVLQEAETISDDLHFDSTTILVLGNARVDVGLLSEFDPDAWTRIVGLFQGEFDRIKAEAQAKIDRKDRFDSHVRVLLSLGAKEIEDGDNSRIELGGSKVILADLELLNEADQRWDFTLTSFQDEAKRIKDAEAERLALREKRSNELRPYIVFIRDYEGMLSMSESAYQKEFAEIVEAERLEREDKQRQQERLQTANDRLAKLREVGYATSFADVADLSDVEFDALHKVKTSEHNAAKERQRITNLGLMRKPLLDAQGENRSAEFLGNLSDEEFTSLLNNAVRLKELKDKERAQEAAQAAIDAQRKADEAAKLKADEAARKKAESATDKEKLEEMVRQIQAIVMPTCSSVQGDAIARGAIERLGKLVGHMHEAMAAM